LPRRQLDPAGDGDAVNDMQIAATILGGGKISAQQQEEWNSQACELDHGCPPAAVDFLARNARTYQKFRLFAQGWADSGAL
jgi:hypothetical protein